MPRLPLAARKPSSRARPPQGGAAQPGAGGAPDRPAGSTILLVDDDPAVLKGLQRVLALEGWQVISAASGEQALERLAGFQPDLLITDLCLAEVSGWDLLFHENLHRPKLPIFVITALPLPAAGGADRFADEFFQKPLDLDALVAAIHRRLRPAGAGPKK